MQIKYFIRNHFINNYHKKANKQKQISICHYTSKIIAPTPDKSSHDSPRRFETQVCCYCTSNLPLVLLIHIEFKFSPTTQRSPYVGITTQKTKKRTLIPFQREGVRRGICESVRRGFPRHCQTSRTQSCNLLLEWLDVCDSEKLRRQTYIFEEVCQLQAPMIFQVTSKYKRGPWS